MQTKAAPHSSQLEALQRDNAILKRAVAIQNSRMQEMAGREAEVVQLRAVAKVSQTNLQTGSHLEDNMSCLLFHKHTQTPVTLVQCVHTFC